MSKSQNKSHHFKLTPANEILFLGLAAEERLCHSDQHALFIVVNADADGTFLRRLNCRLTAQSLQRFPLKAHILY